jgi:hypothetical protein
MGESKGQSNEPAAKKSRLGTRIASLVALGGVLCGIGYVGNTGYHVARDGFVAPIILSPDSDMVIQSKLSMSQLMAERIRITTKRDEIDAELQAADAAIEQLKSLQAVATKALDWTSAVTARQARGGARELKALAHQKSLLTGMVSHQRDFVGQVRKDLDAGLVSRSDYAREVQVLNQLTVAAIETDRAQIVSEVNMSQVVMAQQALEGHGAKRTWTPEMLMQHDQLVRVQCDLLKLEAEKRAKTAERRQIDAELAKLDELVAQLKQRPVFRATEANTNVAFVPYTQIDAVKDGSDVYECFWGIVSCKRVGRVTELLPGEVIVPDPWGTPARGQYAIMDLDDQQAAHSRTLRVRPRTSAFASVFSSNAGKKVASR